MAKMKSYAIEAQADERFKVEVTAGTRRFYVDQPVAVGGSDAGATPVDHLFAALAGCIATTARIIARQQQLTLTLNGLAIRIDGALDLDGLAGKSSAVPPGLTGIDIKVTLDSDLVITERNRFLEEMRARCPVYDTIAKATPITQDAA